MKSFAAHGTTATSLRDVASVAGVSIGLVQHHFGTKAGLVKAVDDHVLAVIGAGLAAPATARSTDPVGDFGHRVTTLIAQHPDVIDYLGRAFIDRNEIGSVIFDGLVATGEARWESHRGQQLTRADLAAPGPR